MKYEEIKEVIKTLASGQGFYGRLLQQLEDIEGQKYHYTQEDFNKLKEVLEGQNFKDTLDVVFYFES